MTRPVPTTEDSTQVASVAWYTLSVLTIAYLFSYIDRQILSLMVGPIQRDLGLTDTQFSLLHGLAFAIFYTFMGIPIARWADNNHRTRLIALGVALWSVATMMGAMARQFSHLFMARIAVGVGEAALSPAAYSLIADRFPMARLGRAMGIYSSAVFLGIGLSFIIGGLLVSGLEARGGLNLPWLGTLTSWQATFLIVGSPGILLALWVLTLPEPERLNPLGEETTELATRAVFVWLMRHWRLYVGHFLGFAMITLLFNAVLAWAAELFIRIHGVDRAVIGVQLGVIAAVAGGIGVMAGGWFSDYLADRGHAAAPIYAAIGGCVGLVPFAVAAPLASSGQVGLALFVPLMFFASFPFGPAATSLQIMTPPRIRARVSAVYLFVVNLTGIGFGGTATALMTDYVFRDPMKLHYSMASIALVTGALAIVLLALAIVPYRNVQASVTGAVR